MNPLALADMAPGVGPNSPDANVSDYNSTYIQINGSSGQGNLMAVDGAMVGEMKVVTAMFDAAQGRNTRAGRAIYLPAYGT